VNEISQVFKKHLQPNKDKFYLYCSISFFTIWMLCKGPLRWSVKSDDIVILYFMGVAPNFFAAITFMFWQTYTMTSKIVISFVCVMIVLATGELLQKIIPNQTADAADIYASFAGCFIAAIIIKLRMKSSGKQ